MGKIIGVATKSGQPRLIDVAYISAITSTQGENEIRLWMTDGSTIDDVIPSLPEIVDAVRAVGQPLVEFRPLPEESLMVDRHAVIYFNPATIASVTISGDVYRYYDLENRQRYDRKPPPRENVRGEVEKIKYASLNLSGANFMSVDITAEIESDLLGKLRAQVPGLANIPAEEAWADFQDPGYTLINTGQIIKIAVYPEFASLFFLGETRELRLAPLLQPGVKIEDIRADWRLAEDFAARVKSFARKLTSLSPDMLHVVGLRSAFSDIYLRKSCIEKAEDVPSSESTLRYFFRDALTTDAYTLEFREEKYKNFALRELGAAPQI